MNNALEISYESINAIEAMNITGGGPTTKTSFYYDVAYFIGMFCAHFSNYCDMYSYGAPVAF
jgi:hypothetical protein